MIRLYRLLKIFISGISFPEYRFRTAAFILFLCVLGGIFFYIQSGSDFLVGYDSYFHIRYSQLLGERGYIGSLPWLQFTIHHDFFIDHHLLWHYLLIPFTFGDLISGGQAATLCFFLIAGASLYLVLQKAGVRLPILWSLAGLFSSYHFLYRMSLLRVQSIALALLMIVFLLSSKKKYMWVYIVSVGFVWLYDGFPLLIAITLFFCISRWLVEGKADWKLLGISFLGILTAMIVNPYFPHNFTSLIYNASRSLFLDVPHINLGSEWDPYDTWSLLTISAPVFFLFFITIIYQGFAEKRKTDELVALLLNILCFILVLKSRRFIEYWPIFATLNAALLLGRRVPRIAILGGFLLISPMLVNNIRDTNEDLKSAKDPSKYEGAALWLAENTSPGEIVFNTDWDDFPFLFFYNQSNYYIVGLDPMYLYSYDTGKSKLYQSITRGNFKDPSSTIREVFNSRYVFMDTKHDSFREMLEMDSLATLVFQDRGGIVFQIAEEHSYQE